MKSPVNMKPKERRFIDELIEGTIAIRDDRKGNIVLPRVFVGDSTSDTRGTQKSRLKKKSR